LSQSAWCMLSCSNGSFCQLFHWPARRQFRRIWNKHSIWIQFDNCPTPTTAPCRWSCQHGVHCSTNPYIAGLGYFLSSLCRSCNTMQCECCILRGRDHQFCRSHNAKLWHPSQSLHRCHSFLSRCHKLQIQGCSMQSIRK